LLLCLLAGGCASQAEIKWQQAQADDMKCLSYGAKRGDAAYVQCRAQLDSARTVADAIPAPASPIQPAAQPVQNSPPMDPERWRWTGSRR
jgi:hypothetical protein